MRRLYGRLVAAGGLLVALTGADPPGAAPPAAPRIPLLAPAPFPPSPPPPAPVTDPARLRSDVAALARERDEAMRQAGPSAATERAVVKAQLDALLKRIGDRPIPSAPQTRPHATPPTKPFNIEGSRPVDVVRMAENLFRTGDTPAAYQAFRLVDPDTLPREDRLFVQYMTACCLRKLNKRAEATTLFREVAEARDVDEVLAGCAISQLSLIRRTQDLEAQLEQLQSRPKSR